MQGFVAYLEQSDELISPERHDYITTNFSSLGSGMILFFQLGTGGTEWGDLYHTLGGPGPMYQLILLGYVVFFTFGLFNILTGMVVEGIMTESIMDDETKASEFRAYTAEQVKRLQHMFEMIDEDNSGPLTLDEFENALLL